MYNKYVYILYQRVKVQDVRMTGRRLADAASDGMREKRRDLTQSYDKNPYTP